MLDLFCIFSARFTLQSDNGLEFSHIIIQNLAEMRPGMWLVNGKPRYSQSQGSMERSNQDVRDMLVSRIADFKNRKWSEGLRIIQGKKTEFCMWLFGPVLIKSNVCSGPEDRTGRFEYYGGSRFQK